MNIFRKIIDTVQLYKIHRNLDRMKPNAQTLPNFMKYKKSYKKAKDGGIRRRLYMSIISQLRQRFPFQPVDYSEARKMYEDYFKMPGHIPSYQHIYDQVDRGEEVFVVNFRAEAPTKGKRYNDYYMNSSGPAGRIYKLNDITKRDTYSYINMHSPKGFANVSSINEDRFTNYRYATEGEIFSFKMFASKIKTVQKLIEDKQKVIRQLYAELNSYEKCQF
ncbi:MAG: hypothetical protein WDA09_06715 [Bacteriovoracaceae bacterium]